MKKSRKVRIWGENWKYFVDLGAIDEDGEPCNRIILYAPNNIRYYCNGNFNKCKITAAEVKKMFKERKFFQSS